MKLYGRGLATMTETDAAEVFKPDDFKSIRLMVEFKNITTGTEVKKNKRASLVEIGNKVLVFELPKNSCNVKHNVMVTISRVETKKEVEVLSVTGKVLG